MTHVRAVIGFSMGAQQAFQWAVSHPAFRRPHRRHRRHREDVAARHRQARGADRGADDRSRVQRRRLHLAAAQGIEAYGMVWLGWLTRRSGGAARCGRARRRADARTGDGRRRRRAFRSNDANDLILQARTWQRHDVGTTPGFNGDVQRALGRSVPVLYMPSETDLYFPLGDARHEAVHPDVMLRRFPRSGAIRGRRREPGTASS